MSNGGGFIVPANTLMVTPDIAPRLHALLADGRRKARSNALVLDARLQRFLDDLDAVASAPTASEPSEHARFLSTTEVRQLLRLGTNRAVLQLGQRRQWTSRLNRGRREFLEADVLEEAELRGVA